MTDIDVSDVVVQQHLYPNPVFQGNNCKLDLLLKYESSISVAVFDIIGNKVVEIDEYYHKGNHNLLLQTNNLEKGVYFVNIVAGYEKYVKRLIIR